jgi:4-carboxymuconolactone decarboxylase
MNGNSTRYSRKSPSALSKVSKRVQRTFARGSEENTMSEQGMPKWYAYTKEKHKNYIAALEQLGEAVRKEGPLDEKTSQLIQLAAAAAIRSEGSVHSHTRRAVKAGASPEEVFHAIILLTSTIGFPSTSAALSWAYESVGAKEQTG